MGESNQIKSNQIKSIVIPPTVEIRASFCFPACHIVNPFDLSDLKLNRG
jgi:hypothetical protein